MYDFNPDEHYMSWLAWLTIFVMALAVLLRCMEVF